MTYLILGSVWKNEDDYALDFIKYHRYVGVEKFIILDRTFTTLPEILKNEKDVEVIYFPEGLNTVHAEGWAKLIDMCKGQTKWLSLIDADQCLVPVQTDDVKDILKSYEPFASLQCNWNSFGSGGSIKKEIGSIYERFLMRAKHEEGANNHTQFICQPDRTLALRTHDPHHPRLAPNEFSVNTEMRRVQGPFSAPPLHNVLWIAHYINKSKEEWLIKNAKGRADIFGEKMPSDIFDAYENIANAEKEERVLELWNKANK